MKGISFIFLFICISIQTCSYAQTSDPGMLGKKFDNYLQNNFQEKIYIHTDKSAYLAGEIVWFKVYNVEAYTNRRASVSKVAYLELLDSKGKPVLQTKIALQHGGGAGSLYLPVSLQSGNYTLRSYTGWMKNFDAGYYFYKDLIICNTLKEEHLTEDTIPKQYAIQFFPEGGNLVSGLKSKVAFRAVDHTGQSFDFQGAVVNGRNDTIVKFKPYRFGIGNFYFKPENGQPYRVLIRPANGKSFSVALPQIFEQGVVMGVRKETDAVLHVTLQTNLKGKRQFILLVHSGRKVVFVQTLPSERISEGFYVPVDSLGDGVSHFTLFNSAEQAVCERLYFKKPSGVLNIDVSADKQEYSSREKVNVSISQTCAGNPVSGDFSISVYEAGSASAAEDDIATDLWLTSELKGTVENASWYLSKSSDEEAADNLMLTHGWRRFKWEDILRPRKQTLKYLPEIQGHVISGRIFNSLTGSAVPNCIAFLSVPGRRSQLYTAVSDIEGKVNFYTRDFYGNHEIVVQTDPRTDSLARVEINSPYSESFIKRNTAGFNIHQDAEGLLRRSIAMQVNNIYYGKYLNREVEPHIDSMAFYDRPDKIYKLDEYVRFTTMEEVLREYVPELLVSLRKNTYHLTVFDSDAREFYDTSPFLLVDGVPVFDGGNAVTRFDPMKIQRLEILTHSYLYGQNTFSGIAGFQTYKGDLAGFTLPERVLVRNYDGLQNKREFYAPMYDGDTSGSSRLPDYRTTLFWNADNQTDKEGKARLSFFTSDLDGKYIIQIQSLSEDGEMGSATATLNVAGNSTGKAK